MLLWATSSRPTYSIHFCDVPTPSSNNHSGRSITLQLVCSGESKTRQLIQYAHDTVIGLSRYSAETTIACFTFNCASFVHRPYITLLALSTGRLDYESSHYGANNLLLQANESAYLTTANFPACPLVSQTVASTQNKRLYNCAAFTVALPREGLAVDTKFWEIMGTPLRGLQTKLGWIKRRKTQKLIFRPINCYNSKTIASVLETTHRPNSSSPTTLS